MSDPDGMASHDPAHVKIAIVGPCASGKSTLAAMLQERGYDVHVSGQEHSDIVDLWRRQHADFLIGLNLDLETLRQRRGESWSRTLFETQQRRLQGAFEAADVVLNSARLNQDEIVAGVIRQLESRQSDSLGKGGSA